jgi:3-oxoadipate enol-lactonase
MEFVKTRDGVRIAIDVHDGGPEKPRLALVHSLAMDHGFWQPVVERLAPHASIVAIDACGHGASDKPAGPYRAEGMAADLADVLDALGWDAAVVAGASMGGCIALQFAADFAARTQGVGLIDTTAWYGETAPKDWTARADKVAAEGLQALVEFQRTRWFSDGFQAEHPEVVERCVATFLANDAAAFGATCGMLGAFDGRAALARITAPAVVIVGEHDYATPKAMAEKLHDALPGSRLAVIPGARHLTPLETPDIIVDELRQLLEGSLARR